jgi:septum site-determining protein MinD
MTRIITITSGKGGVGKTTTVTNLGLALMEKGQSVIILDGNVTTPNLSLHLGIPFYPITLHDVLDGVPIEAAMYEHDSGIRVIPASLSTEDLKKSKPEQLQKALWNLLGKADIIIVDSAAGLGKEAISAMNAADELIVVTNPELPAITDALKTIKLANENGTTVLGAVINRRAGKRHEMDNDQIEEMLEVPILGTIPEDINVQRSISKKNPVVNFKPKSRSSRAFRILASRILGQEHRERTGLLEKLFPWLS